MIRRKLGGFNTVGKGASGCFWKSDIAASSIRLPGGANLFEAAFSLS